MSPAPDPRVALIEYLRGIDTCTLSNAIELLKLRPQNEGFGPRQIRCHFPEFGRMVGYAVTVHVETMSEEAINRRKFLELYEAVAASAKPAVVVYQELGPHADFAAHCGEVMATVFTRLGAIGLVSDCAVRDVPEVKAMRFQYFSAGTVASHAYFRIVRVGIPVQVRGMIVRPGELLHGDENGLVTVPAEALDQLPDAIDRVRSRERALMEFVAVPNLPWRGCGTGFWSEPVPAYRYEPRPACCARHGMRELTSIAALASRFTVFTPVADRAASATTTVNTASSTTCSARTCRCAYQG